MYRDDHNAMVLRLEQLSKENEATQALREEIMQLRRAVSMQPAGNPYLAWSKIGPGERAALGAHSLEKFPVWALGVLHVVTLGLFSLIWFGLQQGKLPRAAYNDPSAGQAIGFQFIPFFNYYWVFFSPMRLCDRVTLQYRLRGRGEQAPKGVMLASAVVTVIPYVGLLALPTLWLIASCLLQSDINRLVDLGPVPADEALLVR
ncbi:MAG TPA: hypothetical protein VFF06_06790 [Polyangia bacterium]|nr:hypothetical protein [Polyangia bacterium]